MAAYVLMYAPRADERRTAPRGRRYPPVPSRPASRSRAGARVARASGPRALPTGAAARVGKLLREGGAHKALHANVVPHAELFQPSGNVLRNPGSELHELLVVLSNEPHPALRLPASRGTVNHGVRGAGRRRAGTPPRRPPPRPRGARGSGGPGPGQPRPDASGSRSRPTRWGPGCAPG